jgi:hypothetical protein
MREARPRPLAPSALTALLLATALLAPVQATGFTVTKVEVEMEASEDVLVMNSDVDLTFTVTDLETGDPVTDCEVEVHIERETSGGSNGNGHMHGEPVEVPDGVPDPAVEIDVTEDPKSGWNLHLALTNFVITPESASTANVWGEGHTHLYVDDVKVGRLYTEWFHIGGLEKGEHTVRVTLNTNDHQDMTVDGVMVEDTVTFTETRDPAGHSHMMMPKYEVPDGVPTPGVDLQVHEDPKSGWNVQMTTTDFLWAPENASTAPVMGEGHAHLYVNGEKVARVYGEWYYLGALEEGTHEVRVTLNANNHSDYAKDGEVIEDTATIVQEAGTGTDGHGTTSVTVVAEEGKKAGTYVVSHHFEKAGDYNIEVHVMGEGYGEVSKTFTVEVLEGDPAPITIAGVILYVGLAIGVIVVLQYVVARRKARRLQEFSRTPDRVDDGEG